MLSPGFVSHHLSMRVADFQAASERSPSTVMPLGAREIVMVGCPSAAAAASAAASAACSGRAVAAASAAMATSVVRIAPIDDVLQKKFVRMRKYTKQFVEGYAPILCRRDETANDPARSSRVRVLPGAGHRLHLAAGHPPLQRRCRSGRPAAQRLDSGVGLLRPRPPASASL